MSSTNFTIGFGASSKPSSKVLRPPGGGSSDIFGNDTPATPRSAKNHMASNIFGSEQNSSVKANGDARRAQKNGDSYSRLFGEPDRPNTPAKNHMKSSIPIGGGSPTKNGNGTISSSSSSTNGGSNQHHQNGNGKMENGTTSSTSSEYQNGVSKTENREESEITVAQAQTNQSVEYSNENNNNNNNNSDFINNNNSNNYDNTNSDVTNNSTDNNNNVPPPTSQNYDDDDDTKSILSPRSLKTTINDGNDQNNDENNNLKTIPEVHNDHSNISTTATTNQIDDNNINNNNNNNSSINAHLATAKSAAKPAKPASQHVNHNNNISMQNGDHYTTTRCGSNKSKKHNEFSSPRRDGNGRPIDSNGAQIPISHRLTNMNNPNRSPRSFNPRNPVTGLGVERTNSKPRKWADHKDGNPVTGEGYKAAGGEINTSIPCLNGANQVINKNRIPPGGFSSGLW